ncbi:MAG: hypothetical protein GY874_21970 [Desulfobacteraceae bacterium]|nr:hypothetical protein [Desulfobacteraceae bacterium]
MGKTQKNRHYYAKTGDEYYRLFSVSEDNNRPDPKNNFLKWSRYEDPACNRKLSTKSVTVHPEKIAIKTQFSKGVVKIGDYKSEGNNPEQEDLYNFGSIDSSYQLVQLWNLNVSNGFYAQKSYQKGDLKKNHEIVLFPKDPVKPYWIGAYLTKFSCEEVVEIFNGEKLNRILYDQCSFGNIVTLIKFIQPEWEKLGIKPEPSDKVSGWIHPTFLLSKKYDLY